MSIGRNTPASLTAVNAAVGHHTGGAAAPGPVTPVLIVAANPDRICCVIVNAGPGPAYLGDGAVDTSTGLVLASGATLTDSASQDAWYAVTASGTGDLRWREVARS